GDGAAAAVLSLVSKREPMATLFPYTTLFRSNDTLTATATKSDDDAADTVSLHFVWKNGATVVRDVTKTALTDQLNLATAGNGDRDRKSTRLNSRHLGTSYAVYGAEKKTVANS